MPVVCPICFDNLHGVLNALATPCGHVFHRTCLENWMKNSACCPSCRLAVASTNLTRLFFTETSDPGTPSPVHLEGDQRLNQEKLVQEQIKVAELHTRVAALEALLQGAKEANRKSQQQQEVLINFQQEVLRNFVPLAKIFFLLVAELLRENTDLKRYAARMRAKVASQEALLQDAEEATRKLQQQQKEATRKLQQMQKLELQQETIEVTRL